MKVQELLDTFDPDFEGKYFHLQIEECQKTMLISTEATPLLEGIKDWHVGYFDIDENDGRLFVLAERDIRPF